MPAMFVPAVLETIEPESPAPAIPPADAKPRAIEAVIRALKAHS